MFHDTRMGNNPRRFLDKPKDWAMRVPEDVRKNVAFLGRKIHKGGEESLWFGGTGFFVNIASATMPDRWYVYLVTAKHVVEQLSLGDWVMRANTKDGSYIDFGANKDHEWWFHPTEEDSTDVAITQVGGDSFGNVDFLALPETMFLSDEDLSATGVGPGDEVFVSGLFSRMQGRSRNLPIIRMGNVAMIPDPGELVPGIKVGKGRVVDAEAYLIEARSIGGLSGSPVFVRTTVHAQPISVRGAPQKNTTCLGSGEFFLLGLINGHWEIDAAEKNDSSLRPISSSKPEAVNSGIAVVVPVKRIRDTLHHPELVAMRAKTDNDHKAQQGTTCMD